MGKTLHQSGRSSFNMHPRPAFKRSHSDLSRSATPLPPDPDAEDPKVTLPAFLRQSPDEIRRKFEAIKEAEQARRASFIDSDDHDPAHRWAFDLSGSTRHRDRYSDIIPWANNRIHLTVPAGEVDYINASPIFLPGSSLWPSSCDHPRPSSDPSRHDGELRYIATQGPKSTGVDHFWQMVWQKCGQTAVIVMLTQLQEGVREKCFPYYPSAEDLAPARPLTSTSTPIPRTNTPPTGTVGLGPPSGTLTSSPRSVPKSTFNMGRMSTSRRNSNSNADPSTAIQPSSQITLTGNEGEPLPAMLTLIDTYFDEAAQATVRKLSLTCNGEARVVYHLLFSGWPDFDVPQGKDRTALLKLIQLSNEKNSTESGTRREDVEKEVGEGPRIVHCSAGVGRTGTFISLEYLLGELRSGHLDNEEEINKRFSISMHEPPTLEEEEDDGSQTWPDPVYEVVSWLREQRPAMVQGLPQYMFIYEILAEEWLKRRRHLLEEKRSNMNTEPSPKAMRKSKGFRKMLNFGRDRHAGKRVDKGPEAQIEDKGENRG